MPRTEPLGQDVSGFRLDSVAHRPPPLHVATTQSHVDTTHFLIGQPSLCTPVERHCTMPTTIDASFFPHIVDLIFDLAPLDCLPLLRVCKDWKRRVDARLYHLRLTQTHAETQFPMPTTYALEGGGGDIAVFKTTLYRKCDPAPPKFVSATKVIDLHVPTFKTDIVRVLAHAGPNVTYRLHKQCNLWSTATWKPECLVLFAEDLAPGDSVAYYTQYGLRTVQGCDKLVVHVRHGGRESLGLNPSTQLKLKRLTVVVHPRHRPSNTSGTPLFDPGLIIDLGVLGCTSRAPTTFVMLDESGDKGVATNQAVAGWTSDRIKQRLGYLFVTREVRAPVFMSEAEYRAQVGDEQFEIEINDGHLSRPLCP